MIEHRGLSFISVSQWRGDGSSVREGRGAAVGEKRAAPSPQGLRGSSSPFVKVYLSKGSPTARQSQADSVNVLTLVASPRTLSVIHTLKEVQPQYRQGGESGGQLGGLVAVWVGRGQDV